MSIKNIGQLNIIIGMVILLISFVPNTEAASVAPTLSQSGSWSNTPSFSGSATSSYSGSTSTSGTSPATLTQTTSATYSQSQSISTGFVFPSMSVSMSISITFGGIAATRRIENHCPGQIETICPFWYPNDYSSYRITIMKSDGSMYSYPNSSISSLNWVVPAGEVAQFPVSYKSTNYFLEQGFTYRIDVYGCIGGPTSSNCAIAYSPLIVTLPITNPTRINKCDARYLCRPTCYYSGSGVVQCTWKNSVPTPTFPQKAYIKRIYIRAIECYSLPLFGILKPPKQYKSKKNPRPEPSKSQLAGLPSNAYCKIVLRVVYIPNRKKSNIPRKTIIKKYGLFT